MQGIENWEYAQWVISIARSLRLNPAVQSSAEYTMVSNFLRYMYMRRPWLEYKAMARSEWVQGLVSADNPQVFGKLVEVIGRNLMQIQVQDIWEKIYIDLLISATGNRRYGEHGARSSSNVTVPA